MKALFALPALLPAIAAAHAGEAHGWQFNYVFMLILLAGAWYLAGWRRLVARGYSRRWQSVSYFSGLIIMVIALHSPIAAISADRASVHMVQHLLLMVVAAPLLVFAAPLPIYLWALPPRWRQGFARWRAHSATLGGWRVLTSPGFAWILHGIALWVWHFPALYEAALRNQLLHDLEHASFFFSALLFWWAAWNAVRRERGVTGVLLMFTTLMHSGLLGALMTFASTPWYDEYVARARALGLDVLQDQQLAGVMMWVPAGATYLLGGLLILSLWLHELERRHAGRHPVGASAPSDPG